MKKSFIVLSALLSALVAPFLAGSASAATITYVSVVGNWHDPTDNVPGSQPGDPVVTNGSPTSIVRWGTTTGTPQSGYDYTVAIPPPVTLPGPVPVFSLGTFTHRNFEVGDPSLTSVQLDVVLVLDVDGVQTGPLTFTYTFNHEETPNNTVPCPYPTPPGEGCTDRVTIVASAQPTTFNIGGVDYTLSLTFLDANGDPVTEFITREGGTINTSGLGGQFTLPGVPPNTPALTVTKSGPATMSPGIRADIGIDVQNIGFADAFNATLVDRLPDGPTGGMCDAAPQVLSARVFAPDGVTPVPGKGALVEGTDYALVFDGATCEFAFNALSAASVIGAGERLLIAYRTQLDAGTQNGITLTNVVGATQWYNGPSSDPTRLAYTRMLTNGTVGTLDHEDAHTVTVNFGVGVLSGTAWHDANFNKLTDPNERRLEGWTVELYLDNVLAQSVVTDATGAYQISGVTANYATSVKYELRFVAPGAGPNTAKLGRADSIFTNDLQRIADIVVQNGGNLPNLNLPIEPNGVVYNTMTRAPVAGAVLRMLQAGSRTALPQSCFYDPAQQNQVTLASGYYRFDINFSDPACANGGSYLLDVTPPTSGYVAGYSQLIPPVSGPSTGPFSVPACPGSTADAIPATAQRCEVQGSEFAPPPAVRLRSAGTNYYVHLTLDDSFVPGSSQIFNNHVPLDPVLNAALAISKSTPLLNVTRGQLVPYTITVRNVGDMPLLQDVSVVDGFPAGFRYIAGSARIDNVPAEPAVVGRQLVWSDLVLDLGEQRTIVMLLAVGAGVGEGEFVNRAQAQFGVTGAVLSGEATATVRVVPDPTFDCTDVLGKVFNDANRNGSQDADEPGIQGVRLVTARGLTATTDAYGRYHITCAITPIEGRGSNFILKLDDRTLPSGYRPSTEPVRVQRATRGKALQIDFGASIYRVVSLDLADAVFEHGTTEMRPQWQPRIALLLQELRKSPAVLRLSYVAEVEDEPLVERRLHTVKQEVQQAWKALDCCYELTIEPEVFWRLGSPPKQPAARAPASR